ncbi:hypothetical protein LSUE1_G009823 [Lachnellula suecica]|uniref:Uncharacterized protein n=1 Tax=Lachnellula suecica TaxID=602035 RepID=A0A8T9BUV9_9HELO|nr:hypothetical protein LSUE1_G009823 [Lachnellula suecica]
MCVTNIYLDRFPDGHTLEFRQLAICQYGSPGRPCPTLSTIENPVRKINWGEATTEMMLTRPYPPPPPRHQSPHQSLHRSSGSHHRHSSSESGHRKRHSKRLLSPLRPTRQHRRERIVIVDSPPTPRTPPQRYNQTFTAPASPASPAYLAVEHDRGRPIIVDERPLHRNPSVSAVVAPRRHRSPSRNRHVMWESPSNSHTSFNSRLRREEEDREIQRIRQREIEIEAERRKQAFIRAQDDEIRRRPAVPLAPMPPRRGTYVRPVVTVVDQADLLPVMMGGLAIGDNGRGRLVREDEQEAMKQRLRERQLPKRRASVGPGYRRHRVAYDDGMYRWE